MANSAGIYFRLDGQMLLLCDKSWGLVPGGIGIEDFGQFAAQLRLMSGDSVSCDNGHLQFAGRWIRITEIEKKRPAFGSRLLPDRQDRAVAMLTERKKGMGPLAGFLLKGEPLPQGEALWLLAAPRLERLRSALAAGNNRGLEEAAVALLGLGPGLTPSGDDVLCGLIYGLLHSERAKSDSAKRLCAAVCREAEGRTHPVSVTYLTAIARGEDFERLEEAWCCLTGTGEGPLERLTEVGSSSGGDLLLGLLLAGEFLKETEEGTDG